ncbi:MAG: HAD family phosphatase, partial [Synergistaceae bacterium]|nr:HAD family phosphatase [Synergistaceae bacterium]
MDDIKIIAFDLDGTLLNSRKELTPNTREILERAASKGFEIVPATGRIWEVIPAPVRELDFIN